MMESRCRAWDPVSERYIHVSGIDFVNQCVDGLPFDLGEAEDSIVIHSLETMEWWIGQCDKNGVDIYEGDILATSNNDPKYDIWDKEDFGITVVEWNNDSSGFVGNVWTWSIGDNDSVYDLKHVEVIGNTHQILNRR